VVRAAWPFKAHAHFLLRKRRFLLHCNYNTARATAS
jgi:hypothetical protein